MALWMISVGSTFGEKSWGFISAAECLRHSMLFGTLGGWGSLGGR